MATERLKVILEMVSSQYKREAREASSATKGIADGAERANKSFSAFKSAAVIGGIAAVGRGLWQAVDAAEQSASALANTEQIIKQTGGVANVTAQDILDLSSKLSVLSGVQDEVVQEGANVLLTFKNIRNEVGDGNDVFDRTAALMLDIGAVMGTDASSAALQLGKALNDPVSQMGALSRAGLTFDAAQKDMIKTMVQSGDLLGAQKIILSELETQLGGTAAASADASDKIGASMGEIAESIGGLLLPILDTASIELQRLTGQIDELDRLSLITGQDRESAELLVGRLHQLGEEYDFVANKSGNARVDTEAFTDEARELIDVAGLSVKELGRARDGLDFLVESMELSEEQAAILATIIDEKLNEALNEIHTSNADQWLRSELNPALQETGDTSIFAAEGIEGLNNAYKKLIDPAFAALDALDKFQAAQSELNDAILKFGENSPQAQDAGENLLEAYGGLISAAERYSQESGRDIIDSIDELGRKAGVPLSIIEDLKDELRALDGFVASATVNVTRTGYVPTGTRNTGPTFGFRAGGGSAQKDKPIIVGERGRELFVPDSSGQILPNEALNQMGNVSSSSSFDLTINYPQTTGNDILDGVRRGLELKGLVGIAENTP